MTRLGLPLTVFVALTACFEPSEPMTNAEASDAMKASFSSERGMALTTEPIEIATSFTMGQAVQAAAAELRSWIESQIPCATATLEGSTVTVDFGTLDDQCVYNGHTYAGLWAITLDSVQANTAQVTHEWTGMTNGEVTLEGTSVVVWSTADLTRKIEHDVAWTDGNVVIAASGERTQSLIDPEAGIAGGIEVQGDRDWTITGSPNADGDWHLDIDAVEMRGQDPVPQAGSYTLTNPEGKSVSLSFERIDADTIEVTFTGVRRTFTVLVDSTTGAAEGDEPALE